VQLEVKVGSVSWIKLDPNPVTFAASGVVLKPAWVPKTYIGLAATANDDPPTMIGNFHDFRSDKDFRALTYCHLGLEINNATKAVTKIVSISSFTDPGYTPPFSLTKYPSASVGSLVDGWKAFTSTWSFDYHEGEESPLSSVVVSGRHKNTTITGVPATETVLANQLVKFRAGAVTDDLGVSVVECPYHVPWVWCETVLTYAAGKFKLYGRGSLFPTHAWYLDGRQMTSQARLGDSSFPKVPLPGARAGAFGPLSTRAVNSFAINVPALVLYPVLSKGATAKGPQTALSAEPALMGSVEGHPNTVDGGALNAA
jgi:hypothetical protein